jgi:hypothetical protein
MSKEKTIAASAVRHSFRPFKTTSLRSNKTAPKVLSTEDLALAGGGRKVNEYEGQH